jgi:hypothetical protein
MAERADEAESFVVAERNRGKLELAEIIMRKTKQSLNSSLRI